MHDKNRGEGGVVAVVTIIVLLLIVMILGGGAYFFVSLRQAELSEAERQRLSAQRQYELARQLKSAVPAGGSATSPQPAASEKTPDTESAKAKTTKQRAADHPDADEPPPVASIEQLAWLANHWQHQDGAAYSEEHWLAPRSGIMLGVNRSIHANGKVSFEYLRIESTPHDSLVYYASPSGRGETAFPLVGISDQRVVFEDLNHDFPQQISYWLDDERRLHARISGETQGGRREMEWSWSAAP